MKLTNLTYFQRAELKAIADSDPLLNIGIRKTTADIPFPEETLDTVLGAIRRFNEAGLRGPVTALHSVKRKIQAQLGERPRPLQF